MRQVRQMRGRFKVAKLPRIPKLDRFPLSFERGSCGSCGRSFKNFSVSEIYNSPKLIRVASTTNIL